MATTKQHKPIIDDDFLAGIKAADHAETGAAETSRTENAAGSAKKVLISAKVNAETLKNWKRFCIDYDCTLTDAIKRAMNHYIKDVQSGTIEL